MFLKYSRVLTDDEKLIEDNENLSNDNKIKKSEPKLTDFEIEINKFLNIYNECNKIELDKVIDKWFKIDLQPLKQSLLNTICKWSNLFKQYLIDRVDKM